jgi:hypothetical protein
VRNALKWKRCHVDQSFPSDYLSKDRPLAKIPRRARTCDGYVLPERPHPPISSGPATRRRTAMRPLLVSLTIALLIPGIAACGETGDSPSAVKPTTANRESSSGGHVKDSNDFDNDPNSNDDQPFFGYGHAASAEETRTIASTVKRYYRAAVAHDGATACSMLYSIAAEEVVEQYGHSSTSPELRGTTCAVVMSKLFASRHRELAAETTKLRVTGVRVQGRKGLVLMSFATTPEPRRIAVQLQSGAWKVAYLLDGGMP